MNWTRSSNNKSVAHQTPFRKLLSWSHKACFSFNTAFSSFIWHIQTFCQVLHCCVWVPSSAALGNTTKIYQVGCLILSPGWKLSAAENFRLEYMCKKNCTCHLRQKVAMNAKVCKFSEHLFHILVRPLREPGRDSTL